MSDTRISKEAKDAVLALVSCIKYYVNNPEEVEIDMQEQGYSLIVALRTNSDDVGQVIGRNAYLISSMRSLLTAIAGKNDIKIIFQYITEEDNKRLAADSGGNQKRRYRSEYNRAG